MNDDLKVGQVRQFWSRDDGVETTAEVLVVKLTKRVATVVVIASNLRGFALPGVGKLTEWDRLEIAGWRQVV